MKKILTICVSVMLSLSFLTSLEYSCLLDVHAESWTNTDLCEAYEVMTTVQQNFVSGGYTSYGNVNIIYYCQGIIYFGVNAGTGGTMDKMKVTSGSLYVMEENGNVTDYTSMINYVTMNEANGYVFRYVYISGVSFPSASFSKSACAVNFFDLTVNASDGGIATGSGSYSNKVDVTISATANPNYHFVSWSDGNTDNPRTLRLSANTELTAIFEENPKYTIDVSSIGNGSVTGAGEYYEGTEVVLSAVPEEGYYFVRWSDNTTDILKTVVVNGDITLTAYFDKYEPSACKFSTQLLEDDHIFNLIKSVQQSFEYGNQVWSDWVIYHKFVYLTWETQLEPFSYDIKYPVLEYYEIQSLNDTSYYLRSDVKREYGYVTVYTANWVWSDFEEDVVVDSYTRDTYELIPDIPLSFTDRDGTLYRLSPVTVSNMVMTKTCFGEGYDDGQMQSMQYGVLSQILSFLQNKLTGLGNEQALTNNKLEEQKNLFEIGNSTSQSVADKNDNVSSELTDSITQHNQIEQEYQAQMQQHISNVDFNLDLNGVSNFATTAAFISGQMDLFYNLDPAITMMFTFPLICGLAMLIIGRLRK